MIVVATEDTENFTYEVPYDFLSYIPNNLSFEVRQELALLTVGPVSDQMQEYVKALAKKLDMAMPVAVLVPSLYAHKQIPFSRFVCALTAYNVLLVNEDWVNGLNDEEKRWIIGDALYSMHPAFLIEDAQAKRSIKMLFAVFTGLELAVGLNAYKYLTNNPPWGYELSRFQRIAASIAAAAIVELLITDPILRKCNNNHAYAVIKKNVTRLDCLEGALSVYRKMVKELEPVADTFDWKVIYTALTKKMIPCLEQIKKEKSAKTA